MFLSRTIQTTLFLVVAIISVFFSTTSKANNEHLICHLPCDIGYRFVDTSEFSDMYGGADGVFFISIDDDGFVVRIGGRVTINDDGSVSVMIRNEGTGETYGVHVKASDSDEVIATKLKKVLKKMGIDPDSKDGSSLIKKLTEDIKKKVTTETPSNPNPDGSGQENKQEK